MFQGCPLALAKRYTTSTGTWALKEWLQLTTQAAGLATSRPQPSPFRLGVGDPEVLWAVRSMRSTDNNSSGPWGLTPLCET